MLPLVLRLTSNLVEPIGMALAILTRDLTEQRSDGRVLRVELAVSPDGPIDNFEGRECRGFCRRLPPASGNRCPALAAYASARVELPLTPFLPPLPIR
jgi:hypothetical protein